MGNHRGGFDREQFPEGQPWERKHVRRSLLYGGPRARYPCPWWRNYRRLDWRGAPLTASNLCSVCRHCSHCSHPGTRNLRRDVGRTWTAGVCGTAQEAATYLIQLSGTHTGPASAGFFTQAREKPSPGRRASGLATTPHLPRVLPDLRCQNRRIATPLRTCCFFASDAVKPLTFAVRSSYLR